jgi:radical SAM protein with 4Fe4S-binding SPASM domain
MKINKDTQLTFAKENPFGTQAKLLLHSKSLYEYLYTGNTSSPIFMEVGLTNKCNMNCYWCITENGRDNKYGAEIHLEPLKQYFIDFKEMGGKALTFSGQGEPTLYPFFKEAAKAAKNVGLQLGLMTNGVFSTKLIEIIGNLFEWTRFSVDMLDEEKYIKCKGINGIPTIKRNIIDLQNYPVRVGINCNVGADINPDNVQKLIDWVDSITNISYLQFRPILPRYYKLEDIYQLNDEVWKFLEQFKNHPKIILSDDKRLDLLNGNGLFNFNSCEGHFFEPFLDAEGNIKVCSYHPQNRNLIFGNIYEKSIKEIWVSQQRKIAIDHVRKMNYCKECQACCKLAEPNKLIDFLTHPENIEDVNFL